MNTRIRLIREQLKLSRSAFGRNLGVSGDVINNLERGRVEPKESIIKLICREFNVNEKWLRTGEGEMFEPAPHDMVDEIAAQYGLSPEYAAMIRQLIKLPEDVQRQLVGIAFDIAGVKQPETDAQREARLLREEAEAVEQEGEKSSASPLRKDA